MRHKCSHKPFRMLSAFLLALVMVFASVIPAFAAVSVTPSIVFTNRQTNQPDLYVTKTVTSAVDGYDIPDAEFTFVLKWDLDKDGVLEYASNEKYTVYASDGTEVKNYDSTGTEISFKTDSAGRFTLTAGQTAKFEYVGTGVSYEISEINLGENWVQTTPASGTNATGTVDASGTLVYFENMYVPTTGYDPELDETQFSITKYTVDVNGNSYDSDEAFEFTILVGYEPLSNHAYTIYDLEGNEVGSGTTDENGVFSITGNQTVIFSDVMLYEDYSVTESESDDWACITGSTVEGGTVYPIVYTFFTNQLEGGHITLTKVNGDGDVLEGAVFGIYSDETCETLVNTMESGEDGVALSDELNPGTYYVKENTVPEGYALSTDIYTVEVTSNETSTVTDDGTVENLRDGGYIYLTKMAEGSTDTFLEDAVFGVYSDSECETLIDTLTTDASGYAESQKLSVGTYYVKEITAPEGYLRSDEVYTVEITGKNNKVAVDGDDGIIENTVENGSITIIKKDEDGNVLEGVEFEIKNSDGTLVRTGTTDSDGKLVFDDLPADVYYLTETKTVSGQQLLADTIPITIPLIMTQDEIDEQGNVDTDQAVVIDGVYYFYNLTYEVTNEANLVMPTSGGNGWFVYGMIGFALVAAAGVSLFVMGKRKKEVA